MNIILLINPSDALEPVEENQESQEAIDILIKTLKIMGGLPRLIGIFVRLIVSYKLNYKEMNKRYSKNRDEEDYLNFITGITVFVISIVLLIFIKNQ